MPQRIVVFGHPGCPAVPLIRTILERSGAEFDYINIREHEAARLRVLAINHGDESVPTLVFPDGSTMTEPSSKELRNKLESLGYDVQLPEWIGAFETLLKRISSRSP